MLCIFVCSVVIPFAATLLNDTRCFSQAIFSNDSIEYKFSYDTCVIYSHFLLADSTNCAEYHTTERSYSFDPPFIYSGQCRDAILLNFIPMMIIKCAFDTFILPLLFTFLKNGIDLNSQVCCCMGTLRGWMVTNSSTRVIMTQIWSGLLMLLTYGLLSPYATVAIAMNVVGKILLLRADIIRYFHLQVIGKKRGEEDPPKMKSLDEGDDDEEDVKWAETLEKFLNEVADQEFQNDTTMDARKLEAVCKDNQYVIAKMLWPGVMLSCILCASYTFDMALDTDDLHLSIPLVCLILSIAVGILVRQIFFHLHAKLHDQSEIFVKGLFEIELSGTENPMRRSE